MNLSEIELPSVVCRNVLIVDDDESIHNVFDLILRPEELEIEGDEDREAKGCDFVVHHALSGEKAVGFARRRVERFSPLQLAFVDLKMAGMDGIETIRELNDIDPRLIFIIATGFPEEAYERVNSEIGTIPVQVLQKPIDFSKCFETVASLCCRWQRLHLE